MKPERNLNNNQIEEVNSIELEGLFNRCFLQG